MVFHHTYVSADQRNYVRLSPVFDRNGTWCQFFAHSSSSRIVQTQAHDALRKSNIVDIRTWHKKTYYLRNGFYLKQTNNIHVTRYSAELLKRYTYERKHGDFTRFDYQNRVIENSKPFRLIDCIYVYWRNKLKHFTVLEFNIEKVNFLHDGRDGSDDQPPTPKHTQTPEII